MIEQKSAIGHTKKWIETMVIGLNLCPFAKFPYQKDLIKYVVYEGEDLEKLVEAVYIELDFLLKISPSEIETSLVITPTLFPSFEEYLEVLSILEELLEQMNLEGIIQIASFHPQYQFAGSNKNDVENYTNRSPFPMFHLIREDSIEKAVQNYPNADQIPEKNMETMRTLGLKKIQELLSK